MGKKILLADDDPDLRFLTEMVLSEAGFEVSSVNNGRDAVNAARANLYDVILMDAEMPVLDGYEAYQELLADPATCGIPVVFLTAKLPEHTVDYILKPYDADELPQKILQILKSRS